MNAPRTSSSTQEPFVAGSTSPTGGDVSGRPAPLSKADVDAFTMRQNDQRENQTQSRPIGGPSNTVQLDLDRYRPLFPPAPPLRESFRALQRWEGYVLDVLEETFTARLVPLVGEGSDQEAEIYLEEVDPDDRLLIEPGALFYWSIGYLDRPSGRLGVSLIRFRRLPPWTKEELQRAKAATGQFAALFSDE